jgi:hypothetical protein
MIRVPRQTLARVGTTAGHRAGLMREKYWLRMGIKGERGAMAKPARGKGREMAIGSRNGMMMPMAFAYDLNNLHPLYGWPIRTNSE